MSGARAPPAGCGSTGAWLAGPRPKRWPAASAMSASSAIPATAQGSALPTPSARGVGAFSPTGVPHRWQNLAPGVSDARHVAHATPCSGVPQLAQNRPLASAPQDGQDVEGEAVIGAMI